MNVTDDGAVWRRGRRIGVEQGRRDERWKAKRGKNLGEECFEGVNGGVEGRRKTADEWEPKTC